MSLGFFRKSVQDAGELISLFNNINNQGD